MSSIETSLPGLKLASRFARIVMVSPVRGLRPWRSFLSFTTKLPNPRRSTRSFDRSDSAIISRTESTAISTSALPNSVAAATFSISCCFVILLECNGSVVPIPSETQAAVQIGRNTALSAERSVLSEPQTADAARSRSGAFQATKLDGPRARGRAGGKAISWGVNTLEHFAQRCAISLMS